MYSEDNSEKTAHDAHDAHIERVEDQNGRSNLQTIGEKDAGINVDAMRATAAEHEMSLLQAIKTYKKAALWSILMSTSIVMEGYDTVLVSSFIGYPAFRQKYGVYHNEESGYQISSSWQAALSVCGSISNILGALLNGYFTGKYGHRFVSMTSLIGLTAFIFIVFFSPNLGVLLAGQFLCGISWGVFATSGPSYAAEVSPLALRGHLTSYANLCWTIGQFISAGVLRALVDNTTEWGYRIPFAVQWVWPVPLFLIALFAPESPWYLVRVGKIAEAKKALMRLSEPEHNVDYDAAVALMVHTDKMEKENTAGTSYLDAFRGTNRRRTEIACMLFLSQVADGSAFAYSATFFFEQAGISATASYGIGLGGTGIAFVGTLISWLYIGRFGRRTIWLWGFCLICTTLLLIGILASVKETLPVSYAQAVLCLIWLGGYSMSVGPIVYAIVSEIGSTRLRIQTIVLGRSTYYLGGIFAGVIEPYFMSPTAWNLQGKTAFVWFGTAFLMTLWGYFRLPETKGRTFGEMEYLFKKRIPARKFGSFEVDEREEFQC